MKCYDIKIKYYSIKYKIVLNKNLIIYVKSKLYVKFNYLCCNEIFWSIIY